MLWVKARIYYEEALFFPKDKGSLENHIDLICILKMDEI